MELKNSGLKKFIKEWEGSVSIIPNFKYLGSKELRKVSKPVKRFDKNTQTSIRKLANALRKYKEKTDKGIGLAAPQIGIQKRMIAIYLNKKVIVLTNPKITKKSKEKTIAQEWCISLGITTAQVVRPKFVTACYLDEKGREHTVKANKDLSRLLQHEIDHLDGILCTDRAIKNGLSFVYDKKQFKGLRDVK